MQEKHQVKKVREYRKLNAETLEKQKTLKYRETGTTGGTSSSQSIGTTNMLV